MYTNYGDVNALTHGGIWIQQTGETTFEVVRHTPSDTEENTHYMDDMLVDISDDWIEWDSVKDSCDTDMSDDSSKVLSVIWYYSPLNFDGHNEKMTTEELREFLENRGIETE